MTKNVSEVLATEDDIGIGIGQKGRVHPQRKRQGGLTFHNHGQCGFCHPVTDTFGLSFAVAVDIFRFGNGE